jgi:hypothetical protein
MSFEKKTLETGEKNPKYVDLCDEDPPIAGQKFACMSFISPENVLKKREIFLFDEFVKQWDFTKSMTKFHDFIHFISYKYNLNAEDTMKDFTEFLNEEGPKIKQLSVEDDYKNYLDKNEDKLNAEFQKQHAFQTSIRGLKIRGSFATQEEAENRCKKVRELDPNFDIFVAPVGVWLPWHPDPYKTGEVNFMEEQLNELHRQKIINEEKAKQEFEKRVLDTKREAIKKNIELAQKNNNVLTQTIDEQGNLIGVRETINFDDREVAEDDDPVKNAYNLKNEILS